MLNRHPRAATLSQACHLAKIAPRRLRHQSSVALQNWQRLFQLFPVRSFPRTAFNIVEIVAHLLERKPQREDAFGRLYR
jgi:hypothetical protein